MVDTSSRTFGWNEFALAAAAATAAAIGTVLILGFNLGGERFAIAVDDIGSAVAALVAAAACAWTAGRSKGRFRRGWALMAASAAAWNASAAGSKPASRSIRLTVLGEMAMPSFRSSPTIR